MATEDVKAVWLDCDPGRHDDAFAILLAAHSPSIKLLGISTVAGNQSIDKTTFNAWKMAAVANLPSSIPVIQGQGKPLLREGRHDPDIHGESGLEGSSDLGDYYTSARRKRRSVLHSIDSPLVQLTRYFYTHAALTNVALLLTLYPNIHSKIEQAIAVMGGAIGIGNRSPVAEFNILLDPEAARVVFSSSIKTIMVPLEVTHTALATEAVLKRIKDFNTPFGDMSVDLLTFFKDTYERVFGFKHPPVHDPCAMAYVIAPGIFRTRSFLHVEVVVGDHKCAGQTVCDVWKDFSKDPPNVHVAEKMDVDKFWDLMIDALKCCDKATPFNAFV
eukprot:jgi/Bigna1/40369/e_gw1.42.26.1